MVRPETAGPTASVHCSAARTPAAVAARVVPQPVAQSGADGHVRLTAGLVEAEMAAGEHSSIHRMLR